MIPNLATVRSRLRKNPTTGHHSCPREHIRRHAARGTRRARSDPRDRPQSRTQPPAHAARRTAASETMRTRLSEPVSEEVLDLVIALQLQIVSASSFVPTSSTVMVWMVSGDIVTSTLVQSLPGMIPSQLSQMGMGARCVAGSGAVECAAGMAGLDGASDGSDLRLRPAAAVCAIASRAANLWPVW